MQRSNLFKFSTNITSNMSDDVQLWLNLAVSIKNDDHSYSCHCKRTFFVINIHRPVAYDTICAFNCRFVRDVRGESRCSLIFKGSKWKKYQLKLKCRTILRLIPRYHSDIHRETSWKKLQILKISSVIFIKAKQNISNKHVAFIDTFACTTAIHRSFAYPKIGYFQQKARVII